MGWLLILLAVILCFGSVLLVGAPYLPSLKRQINTGLDLLDLRAGETMLELGCGDGRVLIAAAKRGINIVGYELNPILAALCWVRTRRYRRQVRVVWGDFWKSEWPKADGIYAFILQRYMAKLDTKITQQKNTSVKLVSFAFPVASREPAKVIDGLYLYIYS